MLSGINRIPGHRIWFVESFMVWGQAGLGEIEYLAIEKMDSTNTIFFNASDIGDSAQTVSFANLIDHRGNNLPTELSSPRVMVRSRGQSAAYVLGAESAVSFKIARESSGTAPVLVDLLIIEMGD